VGGRAFAEDDSQNHATAKRYGVVMGTSHEAPMMRGIEEWNRHPTAYGGTGEWSFARNADVVNVGDMKNLERPTQFFLDYAWNPDAIPVRPAARSLGCRKCCCVWAR